VGISSGTILGEFTGTTGSFHFVIYITVRLRMSSLFSNSHPNALDALSNIRLLDVLSLKGEYGGVKNAQMEYPLYNGLSNSWLVILTPDSPTPSCIFLLREIESLILCLDRADVEVGRGGSGLVKAEARVVMVNTFCLRL
jgi:hypothetical protein